jgi:predicted ester cyclase
MGMPNVNGPEAVERFLRQLQAGFPDAEAVIEAMKAEEDTVGIRWTFRGTHEGEWMGISPTGKRVRISATTIDRLANGKIAQTWFEYDAEGMMEQLVVVPPTDGNKE